MSFGKITVSSRSPPAVNVRDIGALSFAFCIIFTSACLINKAAPPYFILAHAFTKQIEFLSAIFNSEVLLMGALLNIMQMKRVITCILLTILKE